MIEIAVVVVVEKGGVGDDSKGNCRGARELDCCRRMGVDKAVTFFQN